MPVACHGLLVPLLPPLFSGFGQSSLGLNGLGSRNSKAVVNEWTADHWTSELEEVSYDLSNAGRFIERRVVPNVEMVPVRPRGAGLFQITMKAP